MVSISAVSIISTGRGANVRMWFCVSLSQTSSGLLQSHPSPFVPKHGPTAPLMPALAFMCSYSAYAEELVAPKHRLPRKQGYPESILKHLMIQQHKFQFWQKQRPGIFSFLMPHVSEIPPRICGSQRGTGKVVQCGLRLFGRMIFHQVSPSERVRDDSVPRQRHQVRQVPVTGGVGGCGSWDLSLPAVCSTDPELAVRMAKG